MKRIVTVGSFKNSPPAVLRRGQFSQPCASRKRSFSGSSRLPLPESEKGDGGLEAAAKKTDVPDAVEAAAEGAEQQEGAMSRRLTAMTEDLLESEARGTKAVEESGFSEELKAQLLERVKASTFRQENIAAFTEVESLPRSAGRGTRDIATSAPWTGSESDHDAVLRMLVDAHKPLKGTRSEQPPPIKVTLPCTRKPSSGQRLADARDRTTTYTLSKDSNLTDAERAQIAQELKDRFAPDARPMPRTLQGLASLANERIEDAIARGQFKNLPRGKPLERDYNASSPFLDTTEYFMNKIIQKQDIVPPWIEKQQELSRAVSVFRGRLRNDWKRHAARSIAARGGELAEQVARAEGYAVAEAKMAASAPPPQRLTRGSVESLAISEDPAPATFAPTLETEQTTPLAQPFRDPAWEAANQAYHTLAINEINSLTRSYNLMAPQLAKKPYFSLERELKACYAEIAPQLPHAIKERALAPRAKAGGKYGDGTHPEGVVERMMGGKVVRIYESPRRHYGFREFWGDLWGRVRRKEEG